MSIYDALDEGQEENDQFGNSWHGGVINFPWVRYNDVFFDLTGMGRDLLAAAGVNRPPAVADDGLDQFVAEVLRSVTQRP